MKIIRAQNVRNESMIEFVSDDVSLHDSPERFYAAAMRALFRGTDSDENFEKYLSSARQKSRSAAELRSAIAQLLKITPMPDYTPELGDVSSVCSFRTEWNAEEYVWRSGQLYWLVCWGTAA